jgi:hypothetical protein
MSRSRSSFDLSGAIATATSLSVIVADEQPAAIYRGVPLVSFGPTASGPPTNAPPPSPEDLALAGVPESGPSPDLTPVEFEVPPPAQTLAPVAEPAPAAHAAHAPPGSAALPAPAEDAPSAIETVRRPPKLPDLSDVKDPVVRCEKIIDWIVEAVGASQVFIADAAGLPLAGAVGEAEARLAAAGIVASSVAHLAAAIPGNTSALFELHVGEGPFFQLVGFDVGSTGYMVGLQRPTPLGYRQAHAVRLACRHALAELGPTPPPAGVPVDGSDA